MVTVRNITDYTAPLFTRQWRPLKVFISLECEFRQVKCTLGSSDGNSLDTGPYVYVTGSGRRDTVTICTH
jgi:hypothetical protein